MLLLVQLAVNVETAIDNRITNGLLNKNATTIYGTAAAYGTPIVYDIRYNSSVLNGNGLVYTSAGDVRLKAQGLTWAIAEATQPKGAEIYLESGKSPLGGIVHGGIYFRTGGSTHTVGSNRMVITGDGNIGIGTENPAKLHVEQEDLELLIMIQIIQ